MQLDWSAGTLMLVQLPKCTWPLVQALPVFSQSATSMVRETHHRWRDEAVELGLQVSPEAAADALQHFEDVVVARVHNVGWKHTQFILAILWRDLFSKRFHESKSDYHLFLRTERVQSVAGGEAFQGPCTVTRISLHSFMKHVKPLGVARSPESHLNSFSILGDDLESATKRRSGRTSDTR